MRTSLICKLFRLDSVTSRSRDVNKHGGGVNNLKPFSLGGSETKTNMAAGVNNLNRLSLDDQNKYGRRAHLLKPNLNTSYIFKMAAKAPFLNFKPNF